MTTLTHATHTLTSDGLDPRGYGNLNLPQRVRIAGGDAIAYGIFAVPAGAAMRRVNSGPDVPGPWADVWGHATVIDGRPAQQPDLSLAPGDVLVIDGERYTVALSDGIGGKGTRGWVRRGYPILLHESEVPA